MSADSMLAQMQGAADQYVVSTSLRHSGGRGILLGAATLAVVGSGSVAPVWSGILAVVGLALVCSGVLNLRLTARAGLAADGIALVILGTIVMGHNVRGALLTGGQTGWAIVGIILLIMGLRSLSLYSRMSRLELAEPPREVVSLVRDAVKRMRNKGRASMEPVIRINSSDASSTVPWNIVLGREYAVAAATDGSNMLVGDRHSLRITRFSTNSAAKVAWVQIEVLGEAGRRDPVVGSMSMDAFQSYLGWRMGAVSEEGE